MHLRGVKRRAASGRLRECRSDQQGKEPDDAGNCSLHLADLLEEFVWITSFARQRFNLGHRGLAKPLDQEVGWV
jgi:hypothetical protein